MCLEIYSNILGFMFFFLTLYIECREHIGATCFRLIWNIYIFFTVFRQITNRTLKNIKKILIRAGYYREDRACRKNFQ